MVDYASSPEPIDLSAERAFRVGGATVDPSSHEATFNGSTERVQPQNLKVLVALVRNRGRVVSRDDLIALCWDGRFVGDDVINRAISTLRQFAIRAGGLEIETIPRLGYRLVEASRPRFWRHWTLAAAAALLLAGAAFLDWPRYESAGRMPTIAILPFTAAERDPAERELALDARGALANTLSRTDYSVRLADSPSQVGPGAADLIVSGDVSGSSQKVVATVRVEDTAHHVVVYSNRFETSRATAADLPDQIGAQIAGSLGWTASVLMLERNHPSDPAITAELLGNSFNYETARQIAERAPSSAIAHVILAFTSSYAIPDLPSDQRAEAATIGRNALARVRTLAPSFGSTEIAWCLLHSHARALECEDHLRAGLRRDPFSPGLANWLASELKDVGRTHEALQLATNSLAHDPYDPDYTGMTLRLREATGMHDEADDLYGEAVRGWPDADAIFWGRVYGMLDLGDFARLENFQKKISSAKRIRALEPATPVIAAIKANDAAGVRRQCPPTELPGFKADLCMLSLALVGDEDDAFTIAWRIFPNRIGRTPAEEDKLWLESGRFFDSDILMGPAAAPLRKDPRYIELARRIGVLAYWRAGRLPDFCRGAHPEEICKSLTASR